MRFETILQAEDGEYRRKHESYEAALQYVEYQMGHINQDPYFGGYSDGWGRRIFIEPLDD